VLGVRISRIQHFFIYYGDSLITQTRKNTSLHPYVLFVRFFAGILCLLLFVTAFSQQHPNSPVLRSYVPTDSRSLVLPGNLSYDLWEGFMLVKKANDGDPIAQHELGIRYISGRGFAADTEKAAFWIAKAAAQGLPSACFNLGILQNNGWGIPWNPFEAFRNFQFAAAHEMPDAEYAEGIMYLDNLVLPRDEKEAYCDILAAADSGYAPAFETLALFAQRGIGKGKSGNEPARTDSTRGAPSAPSRLVYLDFSRDTSSHLNDTTLVDDVVRNGSAELESQREDLERDTTSVDTPVVRLIRVAANAGSPEALTILGRWYETGTHVPMNPIEASVNYIRAIHFDSPRAPELLWNLVHGHAYFETLKAHVDKNESDAQFVWAALIGLQFDFQLTQQQAVGLLEAAARKKNVHALIELGLWYAQGTGVEQDRSKALSFWNQAAELGSREGQIRVVVSRLMSSRTSGSSTETLQLLQEAHHDGSVLAEVALGYCYEKGIGVPENTGLAARLYRSSAQRGSTIGFEALKRLYNAIRPAESQFHISDY